jgi:hypothetical protein
LRARPEPTQLEHFTDASFLGKVLLLPANVRPGLTATSILAYLASSSVTTEKSFIILTQGSQWYKTFFFVTFE